MRYCDLASFIRKWHFYQTSNMKWNDRFIFMWIIKGDGIERDGTAPRVSQGRKSVVAPLNNSDGLVPVNFSLAVKAVMGLKSFPFTWKFKSMNGAGRAIFFSPLNASIRRGKQTTEITLRTVQIIRICFSKVNFRNLASQKGLYKH